MGPLVGSAVALWLVEPVVGSRPPAGEDVMAHLVRADFGIAHLVAHGRLDGWFPRFVLGHQEFLFNGPGLTWLLAAIRALTFGAASNVAALKVVCVASLVALPPAVAFLARSSGLGRRASGLAAVLSILVSTPFGIGLRGMFETGLVPHQVGAVFFCLALGAAVRTTDDDRRRWVALLAVSLAALAATHLISLLILGVVMALTLAVLAAISGLRRAALFRLGVGCAAGGGLAGFWLVPFLAHRELQGVVTTWAPPPLLRRLGAIASGDMLFPTGFAFIVLGAWAYHGQRARRDRSPARLLWLVLPAAYLVVAHVLPHLVGLNQATVQLANRGLGYAGLLAVMAVAALVADGVRRWGRRGYAAALAVTAAAAVVWAPGRNSAGQAPEPVAALPAAAAELARRVPDGARFAAERDYPGEVRRTGVIHPETWLARASGRNSLNGFNLESSSTPRAALLMNRLDGLSATRIAHRLGRLGVTHVVATTEDFVARLTRSPRFVVVWRLPPVTILALQAVRGQPPPASQVTGDRPMTAALTRGEPERPRFEIDAGAQATATLALAWSPKWHATLDGRPVRLGRTNDGLIQLAMPAGRHELRLDYRRDRWDGLGVIITLLTALAGGVTLCRPRKDSTDGASRPEEPVSYRRLSVIVPAYNERDTIAEAVQRARSVDIDVEREIIVVDDGSDDGTQEILPALQDSKVRVVFHPHNCGKTAAIRTGLTHATGDLVLIQDADLEYDPEDWPKLLAPILAGRASVVYGSRFSGRRRNMLLWSAAGNRFLCMLTNVLYGSRLSDVETCYKLFDRRVLDAIPLKSERFGFEPEVTAKLLRRGERIVEVPISYDGRTRQEGKKISWRDGVETARILLSCRLSRKA